MASPEPKAVAPTNTQAPLRRSWGTRWANTSDADKDTKSERGVRYETRICPCAFNGIGGVWASAKDQGASRQDSPLTSCKEGVAEVVGADWVVGMVVVLPAWPVELPPRAMNAVRDKAG